MGRPLNKRNFGAPTAGGNEIKVQFHNGTSTVDGWIVKQLASKEFRCSDGTNEADCYLVDVAAASLAANEMSISVKDDSGTVHRAVKIAARKITTAAGDSIKWNFSDSAADGAVEMEEAGDPTNIIAATAMVAGEEYQIVSVGTVPGDLTAVGADADPAIGEIFIATGAAIGNGTVILTSDIAGDAFGI